ncbi:MAG TPA: hypothetical protein VJS68_02610 [Thermoplasmata archaeon]|nr:hypothetical protein [Thermoplasmata archaeon]
MLCRQPGCGRQTRSLYVEGPAAGGGLGLFRAVGVGWCDRDGVTEDGSATTGGAPHHFLPDPASRVPRKGDRVWRAAGRDHPSKLMSPDGRMFLETIPGARWSAERQSIESVASPSDRSVFPISVEWQLCLITLPEDVA